MVSDERSSASLTELSLSLFLSFFLSFFSHINSFLSYVSHSKYSHHRAISSEESQG
jgi:hypothetical protein